MSNAIQIIEKEPYFYQSPYSGNCYMYPTYMVKDGKEFFMFNRREPDDSWELRKNDERKNHLLSTGGAYFKFNGFYDDPIEMLAKIVERKHHFTDPKSVWWSDFERNGFVDFHGNRCEVSAAFHYRIYDRGLAAKIEKAVGHINREEWCAAKEMLDMS